MGGPVGRFVVTGEGELVWLGAVGEHGPNLARADPGTRGLKDDVAAIWRPTGTLVAALVASQFDELAGSSVHDVDIVVVVGAAPAEGQQLAVGRPGGVDDVALFREIDFCCAGAVGVHEIELGSAAAVADEGHGLASLGVPNRGHVGASGLGKAPGTIAVDIANVKFGIALHGGGENDLCAVRRPGGGDVGAREARKRDNFPGFHGIHANLRAVDAFVGGEAGESNARTVRRPARRESDGVKVRKLVLVGGVVIHAPNFLVAVACGTNEGNLRLRDAGQAAGKLADDFVGELVRGFANLQVCWAAAINFADDRLRRRIANVEQPSLNGDFGSGLGQIPEADVIGVGGLRDPGGSFQFRWD